MTLPDLNTLRVPTLGIALEGPVRPRRRKPATIQSYAAKLARIARGAPEVVVKISGRGRSREHSMAHLSYITRNGKLEAENERGERILGKDAVKEIFTEWGFQTAGDSERRRAQTINIVLSMPAGTDPQAVLAASRGFAAATFAANHQYLLALHDDTKHPHVHLAVKAQGFDLTWLRRSKADLQEWRETFAQKLRDQGVEAEATPRRARGVVRKTNSLAMRYLMQEKRSTVLKAKIEAVAKELNGQAGATPRPWEAAIERRQRQVRGTYLELAKEIGQGRTPAASEAATRLTEFLKNLPAVETERQRLERELAPLLSRQRAQRLQRAPGREEDPEPPAR